MVEWGFQITATEYRLWGASNINFSMPYLYYVGSSTQTFVKVAEDNAYLRVEACNGSGCSSPTSAESAVYTHSCL